MIAVEIEGLESHGPTELTSGANAALVRFSPGDGTRYGMILSPMGPVLSGAMGSVPESWLVSVGFPGGEWRTYPFGGAEIIHPLYVMEKLKVAYYEACVYAGMLCILIPQCDTKYGHEMLNAARNLR